MNLQSFIEKNLSKHYGDVYILGHTMISTTLTHPLEPNRITVSLIIFEDWVFSDIIDGSEISSHVKFYEWLVGTFLPSARSGYKRHLL